MDLGTYLAMLKVALGGTSSGEKAWEGNVRWNVPRLAC